MSETTSQSDREPGAWRLLETWHLLASVVICAVCVLCLGIVLFAPDAIGEWAARISGWAVGLNGLLGLFLVWRRRRNR